MRRFFILGAVTLLCAVCWCNGAEVTNKPPGSKKVEAGNVDPKPPKPANPGENKVPSPTPKGKQLPKTTSQPSSSQKEKEPAQSQLPKPASPAKNAEPTKTEGDAIATLVSRTNSEDFTPLRILVCLPMPFYSHTQNFMPIFKHLHSKGHHITMLSPFPQKEPMANWEDIVVENFLEKLMAMASKDNDDHINNNSAIRKIVGMIFFGEGVLREALSHEPVRNLYNDTSRKFDLVITEAMFVQEPLVAFGHKFNVPVVAIWSSFITPEVAYYTGNPFMTHTYVPSLYFPFSKNMNFMQRATNSIFNIAKILFYNLVYLPKMDALMREFFPADKDSLPYLGDMLWNVSFTLMDTNEVLTYPVPTVNNVRGFLGVNSKPSSPLPEEFQKIMDGAEHGVLFFTLGSHIKPSTLKPHIIQSLMYAFSKIPQKVLMKWDTDEPPKDMPPNVILGKWFPQSAILTHENCRGFLSHMGVHGFVEGVANAVPIIALPIFADQQFFGTWVAETGVGKYLDIETITPQIAYETIYDVLNDDGYKIKAVEQANLFKDTPMPKLDELAYWIEFVVRTKGARHLRPGSLDLPWYSRFGLDLLAAALVVTLVPLWALVKILKCLLSLCRRKTTPSADKAKKDK